MKSIIFILITFITFTLNAQEWEITKDPFGTRYFVENLGQFNHYADNKYNDIEFYDFTDKIFFRKQSSVFMYDDFKLVDEEKDGKEIEKIEGQKYFVNMQWLGSNPNTQIISINKTNHYFTFGDEGYQDIQAKGYEKIIYKNLYQGIDVEYTFDDRGGVKYKIIVLAGADISQIKMEYTGDFNNITITDNNIVINTLKGNIIDHKPVSFYDNDNNEIKTKFKLENNIVSFEFPDGYDASKKLIIDPWTISDWTDSSPDVIDIDFDNSGNVYISGENNAERPYKLTKYNSAGTKMYTHSYPYDYKFYSYSEPTIVRSTGEAYIGTGLVSNPDKPFAYRVNPTGTTDATSPGTDNQNEIWHMVYNNCTFKLYGFGGGFDFHNNMITFPDLDLTGTPVASNFNGYNTTENDVASIVMDDDGTFYSLASSSLASNLNNKLQKSESPYTGLTWDKPTGYNFDEQTNQLFEGDDNNEQWYRSVHSNSLALNSEYLYSYSGKQVDAWNKASGNNLGSQTVNSSYGDGSMRINMGIDVDDCNNVYVGGQNKIHIYSFNGSSFSNVETRNVAGNVYDVTINRASNLLLSCGENFMKVESAIYCANDMTITTTSDCSDMSVSVTNVTGGNPPYSYHWSYNDATTASISPVPTGTYYVTVTDSSCLYPHLVIDTVILSCGEITVEVNSDIICEGDCTDITATVTTPGTEPYTFTWSESSWTGAGPHNVCPTSTTTYSVTVTDANGLTGEASGIVTVNPLPTPTITGSSMCDGNSSTLDAGAGYDTYHWSTNEDTQTIDINSTGDYSVTVTDNANCIGIDTINISSLSNPTPTITGSNICDGETAVIDAGNYVSYIWSTNETTQTISVTQTGTYSVTVTDNNNCTGVDAIDIEEYPSPTPSLTGNNFCEGLNSVISLDSTYSNNEWSNNQTNVDQITVSTGGTYSVTVTDIHNCSASANIDIIMYPNPTPEITGDDFCEGDNTTLDAGSYNNYAWSPTNETSQTITVNSSGTYIVTVTDNNNCVGTDDIIINEIPNPTPTITGNLDICVGETTVLDAGSGYDTYTWSDNTHLQTITVSTQGTYSVTVTNSNNCTGTTSVIVNVHPLPTPVITGDLAICSGTTSVLDAGSGYVTYSWNTGQQTQAINVTSTGTYSVTVSDNAGCTGDTSVVVNVDEVKITTSPSQTICIGDTITISANVLSGIAPYTYHWTPFGTSPNSSYDVMPTQQTTYSVYVTDAMGCESTSKGITISLYSPVELEIYANKDSICPGDPVIITSNITNGQAPYLLTDAYGNTVSTSETVYPTPGNGSYTYTVEDQCKTTASDMLIIGVYPIPPISFQADILQGCPPLTVHFVNNMVDDEYSYIWQFDTFNDANLSLSPNPIHTFTESGYYDITLNIITKEGCETSKTIEKMINVYPQPTAKFDALPDVMTILDPTFYFENYSEDADNYLWNFNDGDSSDIESPTHTYAYVGYYNVVLVATSEQGCVDSVQHIIRVKDIFTLYAPSAFSPDGDGINDGFYVVGHGIDTDNFLLTIYDRWGEIIWQTDDLFAQWNGYAKEGDKKAQIGTYVWRVQCKNFEGVEYEKAGTVTLIR